MKKKKKILCVLANFTTFFKKKWSGAVYDYVFPWMKVLSYGWEYIWFLSQWGNKVLYPRSCNKYIYIEHPEIRVSVKVVWNAVYILAVTCG